MSQSYRSIILTIALFISTLSYSQYKEEELKVAFIEKFTNYIFWPEDIDTNNKDLFIIYVVGNDDLGTFMKYAFTGRKIKNREVKIISQHKLNIISSIDILYIAGNNSKVLKEALLECNSNPFLIVSESDGFANMGAHINFYFTKEKTVHFEMNKYSLDESGFKTDYLLLEYAKVIMKD